MERGRRRKRPGLRSQEVSTLSYILRSLLGEFSFPINVLDGSRLIGQGRHNRAIQIFERGSSFGRRIVLQQGDRVSICNRWNLLAVVRRSRKVAALQGLP